MFNFFKLLLAHAEEIIGWLVSTFRGTGDLMLGYALQTAQASMPGAVNWASVQTVIDNINWFFPLSETITFATLYFSLWCCLVTYRAVKSWIPLVSGS